MEILSAILMTGVLLALVSYPPIELLTLAIVRRIARHRFILSARDRRICIFGLLLSPGCMLLLANDLACYPWSESGMLLAWAVAGAIVMISLHSGRRLATSGLNFLAVIALAGICLRYTIHARYSVFAIVPLAPFVNLTLLAWRIWSGGELNFNPIPRRRTTARRKELSMNTQRFAAIAVIFAVASIGWCILGGAIDYRTDQLARSLTQEVDTMWGPSGIVQHTPCLVSRADAEPNEGQYDTPVGSDVKVDFEHHNRYKGLLWFSTYTVNFTGTYRIAETQEPATFLFKLPEDIRALGNLTLTVDDAMIEPTDSRTPGGANVLQIPISPGPEKTVVVEYTTRARDRWAYSSQWDRRGKPGRLRDFTLTARTDFANIDYPKGSVSPTEPARKTDNGATAGWRYKSMRSSQTMGVEMPSRTNAGPIAARMSFFAPVSLAFFFTVLFTVVVLKKLPLHPMHYLFISAGFFAFHILMAYLVDLISIHAAFWICAAVSTALVVSYMRLVAGVKFAVLYVGAAQLVYLVGFSYAFFWVGATGLTLTIGAIATLFVLMQATGHVDWSAVFNTCPDRPDRQDSVTPLSGEARAQAGG